MSDADLKKRFGQTIRSWRGKSRFSQEELAWRAGLHRTYVADIERGARNPSLESIQKLAKALEVSFSTLFEPFGTFPGNRWTVTSDELVDILLVEDNPNDIELTIEAFKNAGMKNHIHVVRDGTEALEFLWGTEQGNHQPLKHRPRLILLDLILPKIGGLEVLRRIKADERARDIPVIILTVSQQRQEISECKRLGVECYIVKPLDFQRFCTVVPKLKCYWGLFMPNERQEEASPDEICA